MDDNYYMKLAIKQAYKAQAQDEVPVGAVLIKEGEVLSTGYNQRQSTNDPTAHAEIAAIKRACIKLKTWHLEGTTLYVTKEPCVMCAGAIYQARIKRLVYGVSDEKGGGAGALFNIVQDKRLNHQVEVTSGIDKQECRNLLQDFFRAKR